MARRRAAWSSGVPDDVERVGVEKDQVGAGAGVHRTLAVDGSRQRLLRGERLLGVPGGTVVGGPVHRCGDGQPGVERRDGCVGAHRQLHAVVDHPAQREGAVSAVRPHQLGDVAVVEQVGGLHAGDHAEPRHLRHVATGHQLGVLDRTLRPRLGVRRQRVVAGRVTDRVDGGPQAVLGRSSEQRAQLRGSLVGSAAARPVGVRLLAPGRAGVQRTVADDLQRSHRQEVLHPPPADRPSAGRTRSRRRARRGRRRGARGAGRRPAPSGRARRRTARRTRARRRRRRPWRRRPAPSAGRRPARSRRRRSRRSGRTRRTTRPRPDPFARGEAERARERESSANRGARRR